MHDDGGGHVRPLDGNVVEVIRDGDAERAQKEAICEIARGQLDALPSLRGDEERKQHEQRECGAGLRENQRVDGTERSAPSGSFPVKTARPRAAETPQRNAAEAMNK